MLKLAFAFFLCCTLMAQASVSNEVQEDAAVDFEEELFVDDECDILYDSCIIQCDEKESQTTECYIQCEEQYEQCLLKMQDEQ